MSYIIITPYIQNPTGICYSDANKNAIIALCEKYDCMIIEDGTFTDFVYEDIKISPCYNSSDRVIYLYNFCKLYLPHLDYSFVVLPDALNKRIIDNIQCMLPERLIRYYVESDFFWDLRQTLIESSYQKYTSILSILKEVEQDLDVLSIPYISENGLFFWIKSEQEIYQTLLKCNIIVSPSNLFSSSNSNNYFRLSIAPLSDTELGELSNTLESLYSKKR